LHYIFVLSPALRDILLTSMAQYSLFVLKVPLTTKQTNNKRTVCYSFTSFTLLFTPSPPGVFHSCLHH